MESPHIVNKSLTRRGSIENDIEQNQTIDLESNDDDISDEEHISPPFRRQILFGIDLSGYPTHLQFFVPASLLFLFMCLYGYLQELVVYGLFERKWSNLQTFLHFAGCIICAEFQSYMSSHRQYSKQKVPYLSMGSAPPRMALYYYFLLTFLKTITMTFTNLAMTRINYPAKTLCKSALPIVTMFIGIIWFRKTYPLRDYVVSFLLVLGLYLFIAVDATTSPQGTGVGLFFVTLSLVGASLIPMVQEHIMDTYEATTEEVLYFSFLGSTIMSLLFTFLSGEAFAGTVFLLTKGTWFMWLCFTVFNTCGFLGAACSIALTARFGSVVNALTNTSRKAASIAVSFAMFPERNTLHMQHVLGSVVFFAGIILRGIMKGEKEGKKRRSSTGVIKAPSIADLDGGDDPLLPSKSKAGSSSNGNISNSRRAISPLPLHTGIGLHHSRSNGANVGGNSSMNSRSN